MLIRTKKALIAPNAPLENREMQPCVLGFSMPHTHARFSTSAEGMWRTDILCKTFSIVRMIFKIFTRTKRSK